MIAVTPFYAGIIALLFIALSFRVIFRRQSAKVSVGAGADSDLEKRIRVHANCAEYAPFALLLLGLLELQGASAWLLHLMGLTLLAGRFMHAYGLGSTPQVIFARKNGMILTFAMIAITAVSNILCAIF
ncbi:MAPEG family protein [Roseovarius sp. EL26]|uniref:MAPEG family protein n=1 Tax=Roseovarius sp. EL26 TaxID=2126672 RepID=UPI000EA1760D|nr:MAPEG family protein [Roseovarius sp. EL26]